MIFSGSCWKINAQNRKNIWTSSFSKAIRQHQHSPPEVSLMTSWPITRRRRRTSRPITRHGRGWRRWIATVKTLKRRTFLGEESGDTEVSIGLAHRLDDLHLENPTYLRMIWGRILGHLHLGSWVNKKKIYNFLWMVLPVGVFFMDTSTVGWVYHVFFWKEGLMVATGWTYWYLALAQNRGPLNTVFWVAFWMENWLCLSTYWHPKQIVAQSPERKNHSHRDFQLPRGYLWSNLKDHQRWREIGRSMAWC